MSETSQGATRRGVLKTGAIGSVVGALGLSAATADTAAALPGLVPMVAGQAGLYLQIDGIPGDSTAVGHENWIEINSLQFGEGGPSGSAPAGSGAPTAKGVMSPVTVSMQFGLASVRLFQATLSGRRIANATIQAVRAGESPMTYLELKLQDLTISSDSVSSGGSNPSESTSLAAGRVTYTYWPQKADGSQGDPIIATWDARTGATSVTPV
jgi:type VI protein secretion system component Hcp